MSASDDALGVCEQARLDSRLEDHRSFMTCLKANGAFSAAQNSYEILLTHHYPHLDHEAIDEDTQLK